MAGEPLQARNIDPEGWIEYWWKRSGDPTFHRKHCSPFLEKFHAQVFENAKKGRIFVPLCGKTLDMIYLADQGYEVVGMEYAKIGVESFFKENGLAHTKENVENEPLVKYQAKEKNITIYQGDIFDLKPNICGKFDGTWDRGSYVAVNVPKRRSYAELMCNILKSGGKILMEAVDYDPTMLSGPPHYTTEENLRSHFGENFQLQILDISRRPAPAHHNKVGNLEFTIRVCIITRN